MSQVQFSVKLMFGGIMFDCGNGRYSIATYYDITGKLNVRGGSHSQYIRLGGDFKVNKLDRVHAPAVVMIAMGLPHDEDTWVAIYEQIITYEKAKIEEYRS